MGAEHICASLVDVCLTSYPKNIMPSPAPRLPFNNPIDRDGSLEWASGGSDVEVRLGLLVATENQRRLVAALVAAGVPVPALLPGVPDWPGSVEVVLDALGAPRFDRSGCVH
jgi:hypothetical protein